VQGRTENQERCEGGSNAEQSEDIEIPLFPKCLSPKILLGLALLTLTGLWLSGYGFTTMKYSESVAFVLWAVGFFGGSVSGGLLLVCVANRWF